MRKTEVVFNVVELDEYINKYGTLYEVKKGKLGDREVIIFDYECYGLDIDDTKTGDVRVESVETVVEFDVEEDVEPPFPF